MVNKLFCKRQKASLVDDKGNQTAEKKGHNFIISREHFRMQLYTQ